MPRIYNALEAAWRQGDINHITGDVHYLSYFLSKKKTLLSIMDCVPLERLTGWKKVILRLCWYQIPVKRSALISVISEATKRELLRYVKCDPDKIRVVHCPVSSAFQPCPREFNSVKPVILQMGTRPNKNLFRVAEALKGLPCHLKIVGDLTSQQRHALEECAVEYSNICNISDTEVVNAYKESDLVVFVSTYEGFGLPIVEANATGRPVVTSDILSMPEVAGKAACFVDPLDVGSIRNGLLKVITDSIYRQDLISHGFENVKRFTPKAIALEYVALYEELLSH